MMEEREDFEHECEQCGVCPGPVDIFGEQLSRRGFIKVGVGGLLSLLFADWLRSESRITNHESRASAKACILLWMNGGPSQFETFDPKPGRATGGPTKAIKTSVAGIELAEHLPQLAEQAHHLAVIRSMVSKEGNHQRAQYLLHTGYAPIPVTKHPSFGSIVSKELGEENFDLPHFVSIRGPSFGAGYLGVAHAPFVIPDPNRPVANITYPPGVDKERFTERIQLLNYFEQGFSARARHPQLTAHDATYDKAIKLMHSPLLKAFDISGEPEAVKQAYGDTDFGKGCLMARRLIEAGVKFVEVFLDGWDTHQNNFERTPQLCQTLDPAFAALLKDLHERPSSGSGRRLLDSTLVIWMGEFGRTPRINHNDGRDHFTNGWCVALAGGGIKGGQVIGATNEDGTDVAHRPVTVPDLFASLCVALGINPNKTYITPQGRPIRIVDKGKPIQELFGA